MFRKYLSRKAQIISIDMIFALTLFLLVFALLFAFIRTIQANYFLDNEFKEMEMQAFQISELLVKHDGYPKNWDANNVEVIGLADRYGVINSNKLSSFQVMDYNVSKRLFNVQNYFFRLSYINGTTISQIGDGGNFDKVASIRRIVMYNNGSAEMIFQIKKD